MTLLSVQSFGIRAPGGGPRILRALLAEPPIPVTVVCTDSHPPPRAETFDELWSPARPRLSPLEGTRLGGLASAAEWPFAPRLRRRLEAVCKERGAVAVHAVAHTTDFLSARETARALGLPFLLSLHDDVRYAMEGRPDRALAMRGLTQAWRDADQRYVISSQLGDEYCRRYGTRPYSIVTDGLDDAAIAPRPVPPTALRVYFAGLFHRAYGDALIAFLDALESMWSPRGREISFTGRCGSLPEMTPGGRVPVAVLPFADEARVQEDLRAADVLYMPMPFNPRHADLLRFSLSTKLIAYLGSGRPIVYHGPPEGAAYDLLEREGAAILVTSLNPAEIRMRLEEAAAEWPEVAENGLRLARKRFRLTDQRARFWSGVPGVPRPSLRAA